LCGDDCGESLRAYSLYDGGENLLSCLYDGCGGYLHGFYELRNVLPFLFLLIF
jgi:hypothetical protein